MSERPEECLYCDGKGNSDAGGQCGFCDKGVPDVDAALKGITIVNDPALKALARKDFGMEPPEILE